VDPRRFFFKVYLVDQSNNPRRYLGTAFAVTPRGDLLTCRHVVDANFDERTDRLAVFDDERDVFWFPGEPAYPESSLDMALLPHGPESPEGRFLPLFSGEIPVGQNVYTFGFYARGGRVQDITQGYFSGTIVNLLRENVPEGIYSMTLPYAIIEGMSGSPVLTYHNGPKVVGLAYGSEEQRVVAQEVMDYKDTRREYKETINRIVEFGLAYHVATIIGFLSKAGIAEAVVSDNYVDIEGLK
jgi:trypsin-like peptidase